MKEINEELLSLAFEIAVDAHFGQVDKAGKPYIHHPMRVMNSVEKIEEKIVAILHDTLEDTYVTVSWLRIQGFPDVILEALQAITKVEGEDYNTYINRVRTNPIALKVKIADMEDNMNISRIKNPTEKDYKRLEKYKSIYPLLLEPIV